MPATKHFMSNFNDTHQNGITIQNDIGGPKQHNDNISCVYNSPSTASKTILITNNYSQLNNLNTNNNNKNANLNNSSITIYTHNSDSEGATLKQPKSPRSTVVLDRINILINNHFNEPTIADKNMPPESVKEENSNQFHPQNNTIVKHEETDKQTNNIPPTDPTTNIVSSATIATGTSTIIAAAATISENTPQMSNPTCNASEFSIGQDVLLKQTDDRFYLGTIISITSNQYLVKFDDNTEKWSVLSELTKFNCEETDGPICVVCKLSNETDSMVEVCHRCQRGYHKKCSNIETNIDGFWYCKKCSTQNGSKLKFDKSLGKNKSSLQFSYDLSNLTWDKRHHVNKEQKYCYCARNGEWYMKMMQCTRCRQWFHEHCVKCLQYPLFCGDRFYVFVCSVCNHGKEFVQRLQVELDDAVQLILFNLSVINGREYFNLDNIIHYAQNNWQALQLASNLRQLTHTEIKNRVLRSLNTRKTRFKSIEGGKKIIEYALQYQQPPFIPNIIFPPGPRVSENYAKNFCYENYGLYVIPKSVQNHDIDVESKCYKDGSDDSESILSDLDNESGELDTDDELLGANVDQIRNNSSKCQETFIEDQFLQPTFSAPCSRATSPILINGSSSNDFNADSDRSRDLYDFDEKGGMSKRSSRKRCKMSSSSSLLGVSGYKTPTELIDLCESSDDTSGRSTLNLIIPPPKNFQGYNNPFLSPPKLKKDGRVNGIQKKFVIGGQPLSLFGGRTNILPSAGNIRVVRTVKRRLCAKDIMIGPDMEVKRRKVRRGSAGNVEVISTATIHTLSKYSSGMPIRTDSRDMPVASKRSTPNTTVTSLMTTNSNASASPKEMPISPLKNIFNGGRRLRKRRVKNYSENPRRNSTSSSTNGCSNLSNSISVSANNSNVSEISLTELQSSMSAYFGAATRIGSGEPFKVKGKRVDSDGRNQYLIDWEDVS